MPNRLHHNGWSMLSQVRVLRTAKKFLLTRISGYSVYYSAMGAVTPCFSKPAKAYLPASTASGSGVVVVTDAVFSRRYALVGSQNHDLSSGAIAGIVIGAFACVVGIPALIITLLRRHRRKQQTPMTQIDSTNLTYPSTNPALGSQQRMSQTAITGTIQSVQELASPEAGSKTPAAFKGYPFPPMGAASAHEAPDSSLSSIPVEMPGSTYPHEHHPAHNGSQSELSTQVPPRSPSGTVGTKSPILSPASPYRTESPSNVGNITPLGSPSLGPSPRFREGTM